MTRIGSSSPIPVVDHRIVVLAGAYDAASVADLSDAFAQAIAVDDNDLVVDLSAVTFMDASITGVLVRADTFLGMHSRSLVLRRPSRFVRRLLALCDLVGLIEADPGRRIKQLATSGRP